jgi:hypothetical protein
LELSTDRYNIGISGFIGYKYYIAKRISISTELNTTVVLSLGKLTSEGTVTRYLSQKDFNIDLQPIGMFSLNFHF